VNKPQPPRAKLSIPNRMYVCERPRRLKRSISNAASAQQKGCPSWEKCCSTHDGKYVDNTQGEMATGRRFRNEDQENTGHTPNRTGVRYCGFKSRSKWGISNLELIFVLFQNDTDQLAPRAYTCLRKQLLHCRFDRAGGNSNSFGYFPVRQTFKHV
jgi:hypothetical protein